MNSKGVRMVDASEASVRLDVRRATARNLHSFAMPAPYRLSRLVTTRRTAQSCSNPLGVALLFLKAAPCQERGRER